MGRELAASSVLAFGAELTIGRLPTGDLGCISTACDFRDLSQFGALSMVGVISAPTGFARPYLRANIGAWLGSDDGATDNQSAREAGTAVAGESGIRAGQFAAGLRLDQLNGVRRGTTRLASIVVRVSF